MKRNICIVIMFFWTSLSLDAQQLSDTHVLKAKADSLHCESLQYFANEEYSKCIQLTKEEAGIRSLLGINYLADYHKCLLNIGQCYYLLGDYKNTIDFLSPVIADRKSNGVFDNTPENANITYIIGDSFFSLGNYDRAIDYFEDYFKICETFKATDEDYGYDLYRLSYCYNVCGKYRESLSTSRKLIKYASPLPDECNNVMYGMVNSFLALSALGLGNEALIESYNSLDFYREHNISDPTVYVTILNSIANLEATLNQNFENSIDLTKNILNILSQEGRTNDDIWHQTLKNMSSYYVSIVQYDTAIEYAQKASDVSMLLYGESSSQHGWDLAAIASCYIEKMDVENAIHYSEKALQIIEDSNGKQSIQYLRCLSDYALILACSGDNKNAANYNSQVIQAYEDMDKYSIWKVLSISYINQGHYSICQNDYSGCIANCEKAFALYETFGKVRTDIYLKCLMNYEQALYNIDRQSDKLLSTIIERQGVLFKYIFDFFSYFTLGQREYFWSNFGEGQLKRLISHSMFANNARSYDICYNSTLLYKGLLLNAETEMRDLILESNDKDILALYDRFSLEKRQLAGQLEKPIAERTMPTDSLETVCDKLESELMKKSKAFGDYTKNLAIKWTDVQAKLGKKDIAIEFMEVPVSADTTKYCALTLKKGYDAPHFVELFDLKDLKALNAKYASRLHNDGLIYGDPELYDLVWKPLDEELKGVDNIYFGPSGELYQLAIEYATDGKKTMSEKKNVYRLSSTRQLALIKDKGELKSSSIYGGFKYGASMQTLLADSRNYTATSTRSADPFFSVDSLNIRGASSSNFGVNDLPGTLREATTISGLMDKSHFENTLTVGESGTEAAFKSISGQRRNILHIATHGFYWTKSEAERIAERLDRREMMMSGNDSKRVKEDAALTRSGLLFSGANNALKKGYQKQDGVEDGILTAKEIAQMDLRGTDLLVLSACQTGLGEVSGEGVFGLQRGFKKAGVNSILMSLWEVDDDATQLLMTTFYKNLTSGKSKTESLKLAQDKVRKTPGFESPYFWAAFILLDGID